MFPALRSRADLLAMLYELAGWRRSFVEACTLLSPDQLTDPVFPGTWHLLKNLAHLASAEEYMLAWIHARPHAPSSADLPPDPPLELPAIRVALDEAHAAAIAFLKANPESVLAEACVWGRDSKPETVGGLYWHIVEHELAHRGFLRHKLDRIRKSSAP